MAKNKKSSTKTAKKSVAKPKAAKTKKTTVAKAKKVQPKKAAPKKAVAKSPVKKAVVAKKAAPKKVAAAPKKVHKPEPKAEKAVKAVAPKKVEKVERPAPVKPTPVVAKPAPPQLNIFPVPNQRPIAHKPPVKITSADERTRYSEDELLEFASLINKKLDKARDEYRILKETLNRNNDEGTDATSGGNTKVLEDGAETAEKENLSQLAARQQKYIMNLENALVRIKNGTYGICSVTGKLIPKERLIAVPHTTQSIEAKMMQQD
ncbi:MAG TPA: TraR/DksA C4-type zinc finger protein [Chryseolinea sp.]|nr:TraR/DksA C4-type zinc finger protein [Chryseolinea sp.]